jgi:ATP-binding cassette subfamily B protein/subfamily B ATP-binding cassette protein MsbA
MSIYRRVLAYYRPFLSHTILGLLLSFVGIGLNLLKPWPFKIIVDDVIPRFSLGANVHFPFNGSWWNQDPKTLVLILCLVLVAIQVIWSLLSWGTTYIFVKVGLEALLKLRTDLYSHLQRLSLKYHDARRSADSSFRVAYDSQSLQTIYNRGFINIFGSAVTLISTFFIMLRMDWQLSLLSLAIIPFLLATIYLFAKRIRSQ